MQRFLLLILAIVAIEAGQAQTLIYKGTTEGDIEEQFHPIPAEYTVEGNSYLEWLEYDPYDNSEDVTENTITVYDYEMNSVKRIYVPYEGVRGAEIIWTFSDNTNCFVASQTMFNDDEDFEYIRLEQTSSNVDVAAGFSIVSSDGTVLSYTAFSENLNFYSDITFHAFHNDANNLLIVELEPNDDNDNNTYVYVYKIDKSTSSVKQAFQTVKAKPVVEADDGNISVSGCAKGDRINVYNIDGSLVKAVKVAGSNAVISGLMLNNTYVVKVGGTSSKITL